MTEDRKEENILDQIRSLDRRRVSATQSNDVEALKPLLDDDLVYMSAAGSIYTKTTYLEAISSRELTYASDFQVTEAENRIYPGTVMLIGMMLGHARLDGEQLVFDLRCMSIWRQRGETWALVGWQSSVYRPRPY